MSEESTRPSEGRPAVDALALLEHVPLTAYLLRAEDDDFVWRVSTLRRERRPRRSAPCWGDASRCSTPTSRRLSPTPSAATASARASSAKPRCGVTGAWTACGRRCLCLARRRSHRHLRPASRRRGTTRAPSCKSFRNATAACSPPCPDAMVAARCRRPSGGLQRRCRPAVWASRSQRPVGQGPAARLRYRVEGSNGEAVVCRRRREHPLGSDWRTWCEASCTVSLRQTAARVGCAFPPNPCARVTAGSAAR